MVPALDWLELNAGVIGIYSAVASANHMAPWGGTRAALIQDLDGLAIMLIERKEP